MACPIVTVKLPLHLSNFNGRKLTLEQMGYIQCYCENTAVGIGWEYAFDSGKYTGIIFYELINGKYCVWAVHDTMKRGPKYYINDKNSYSYDVELYNIVNKYLEDHPELGITIDQFM